MAMKTGANVRDQHMIRKLKKRGLTCSEIAQKLKINEKTVQIFMDFIPTSSIRFIPDGKGGVISVPKDWQEGDPVDGVTKFERTAVEGEIPDDDDDDDDEE